MPAMSSMAESSVWLHLWTWRFRLNVRSCFHPPKKIVILLLEFKVLRERYPQKFWCIKNGCNSFGLAVFFLFQALKKALGLSPWQQVKQHLYQSILCAKNLPPWDVGKTFQTPESWNAMSRHVIQMIGMIAMSRNGSRRMTQHVLTWRSV